MNYFFMIFKSFMPMEYAIFYAVFQWNDLRKGVSNSYPSIPIANIFLR